MNTYRDIERRSSEGYLYHDRDAAAADVAWLLAEYRRLTDALSKAEEPDSPSQSTSAPGTVRLPFRILDLIDKVYVPRNPNKIRSATAEVLAAVREWKSAITRARAERGLLS